jgi:hypothetical protein
MGAALILIGVGCVIAAIVGGGVKLQQLEVGTVPSLWRQGLLGVFGFLVSGFGFAINQDYFTVPRGSVNANAVQDVANAAAPANTNALQPTANIAAPATANSMQDAASTIAQVNATTLQAPTGKSLEGSGTPEKPPPLIQQSLNVSGLWLDEVGHRWSFAQEGIRLTVHSVGQLTSPSTWAGRGKMLDGSIIDVVLLENGAEELCKGQAYETSMTLLCQDARNPTQVRRQKTLTKIK